MRTKRKNTLSKHWFCINQAKHTRFNSCDKRSATISTVEINEKSNLHCTLKPPDLYSKRCQEQPGICIPIIPAESSGYWNIPENPASSESENNEAADWLTQSECKVYIIPLLLKLHCVYWFISRQDIESHLHQCSKCTQTHRALYGETHTREMYTYGDDSFYWKQKHDLGRDKSMAINKFLYVCRNKSKHGFYQQRSSLSLVWQRWDGWIKFPAGQIQRARSAFYQWFKRVKNSL